MACLARGATTIADPDDADFILVAESRHNEADLLFSSFANINWLRTFGAKCPFTTNSISPTMRCRAIYLNGKRRFNDFLTEGIFVVTHVQSIRLANRRYSSKVIGNSASVGFGNGGELLLVN